MADDIDIEEHDVIDDPIIRSIFPDLSVLKQEVSDDLTEESQTVKEFIKELKPLESDYNNVQFDFKNDSNVVNVEVLISQTYLSHDAKINKTVDSIVSNTESIFKNKFILGSKPNKDKEISKRYENQVGFKQVQVTLKNLESYLRNSQRYCEMCFILFPTMQAFNLHIECFHIYSDTIKLNAKYQPSKEQMKNISSSKSQCNMCKKYFSSYSNLQKHIRNIHSIVPENKRIKNTQSTSAINTNNSVTNISRMVANASNVCFHCKVTFPNMQSLIEHLYEILQSKKDIKNNNDYMQNNIKTIFNDVTALKKVTCKPKVKTNTLQKGFNTKSYLVHLYTCPVCSYYFKSSKFCTLHLWNKHKITKANVLKKVQFQPKCKFCLSRFNNIKNYNMHIHKVHYKVLYQVFKTKSKISKIFKIQNGDNDNITTNTIKPKSSSTLIRKQDNINNQMETKTTLKSVLFKCNKCDIHFLKSDVAINHKDHMELLINWKCSVCNKIFKKIDEILHQQQHYHVDTFNVYEVSESKTSVFLFKCGKCAVHFDECSFLKHYLYCHETTLSFISCNICDILIDIKISSVHEENHRTINNISKKLTIIETEVITESVINKNQVHIKSVCLNDLKQKRIGKNEDLNEIHQDKLDTKMKVFIKYYCHCCKCFIHASKIHKTHIQSRCSNILKRMCIFCGLLMTHKSYLFHKKLHQRKKDLSLQDFIFYDIKSKKLIAPPIPEYPHCIHCKIHFTNNVAKRRHSCSKSHYIICSICQIKFSELAYKLHSNYHMYQVQNGKNIKNKLLQSSLNLVPRKILKSKKKLKTFGDDPLIDFKLIIYLCKNCDICVDTYDKVVEHCQGHYNFNKKQSHPKICYICDLKFDVTCYNNHEKLHMGKYVMKDFHLLKFNVFNFASNNDAWIKHIFEPLPSNKVQEIIEKSIYKYENKIKLKVIQQGSVDLTVYKCDKCRAVIEPSSLYKHLENCCLKLRKHSCRTCKLTFISLAFRTQHESIHLNPNINMKSYRIVIFNRDEDKIFNNILHSGYWHVLFQCRNCDGVVSKLQLKSHLCNRSDLRKCQHCGLLLYTKDFILHVSLHKECDSFNVKNMKVILLGRKVNSKDKLLEQHIVPSFNGKIYDYLFYRCTKCKVCMINVRNNVKHDCVPEILKSKCVYCGLYFDKRKLKNHCKLHENDVDFVADNITVIDLDINKYINSVPDINTIHKINPVVVQLTSNIIDENKSNDLSISSLVVNNVTTICQSNTFTNGVIEKSANLFKCSCGLHFLDNLTAKVHFKVCKSKKRELRQNCSKCDLTFTPNILFKHLVQHHGNKNINYKFNIIKLAIKEPFQAIDVELFNS